MSDMQAVSGYMPPVVTPSPRTKAASPMPAPEAASTPVDAAAASGSAVLNISPEGMQKLDEASSGPASTPSAPGVVAALPAAPVAESQLKPTDSGAVKRYQDVSQMTESAWTSVKSAVRNAAASVGLADKPMAQSATTASA